MTLLYILLNFCLLVYFLFGKKGKKMMGNDEFSFPIAFLCIFLSDKELSLQIDQFLKQRIRHCDNAGICLETTLRNDHIRKLSGQIHV